MHRAWGLRWFWVCWFGLCCRGEDQKQVRLGLGQVCGVRAAGQCDTNLTCVPVNASDAGETINTGVCSLVPLPVGCAPCSEVECPLQRRGCPGGHVTEPCGCCPQCARQRGQVCGGPHWGRGYCDSGLTCALVLGHARATPPESGICKLLPGGQSDHLKDPLCPWVWGCNVRAGVCDCYVMQTCHSAFSYRSIEDCLKTMEDDQQYWSDFGGNVEEAQACVAYGCEVQGDQCVCLERSCNSPTPLLSENNCENQLMWARCNNVSCPAVPVPSCPSDSFLTVPYILPRKCCPLLPALCTCAFELCPSEPPACPPGHHAHRVRRGNGHPGNCCHRYLCTPEEVYPAIQERDEEEE